MPADTSPDCRENSAATRGSLLSRRGRSAAFSRVLLRHFHDPFHQASTRGRSARDLPWIAGGPCSRQARAVLDVVTGPPSPSSLGMASVTEKKRIEEGQWVLREPIIGILQRRRSRRRQRYIAGRSRGTYTKLCGLLSSRTLIVVYRVFRVPLTPIGRCHAKVIVVPAVVHYVWGPACFMFPEPHRYRMVETACLALQLNVDIREENNFRRRDGP